MSLFGKKKENETPSCCCGTASEKSDADSRSCCTDAANGICCIKILGGGCASCETLYKNTQAAVSELGLSVEVEYITDMQKVMEYGVMSMPALVVNEEVVGMGKVYKTDEVKELLRKHGKPE